MPYWRPTDVIFLAVAGRGVNGAGALFEGDVIGQNAERIALQERMAEDGVLDGGAGESGDRVVIAPAAFFGGDFEQLRGDNVDRAGHVHGRVLELGMVGDGHVGRDGPRGGGPDEAVDVAAGESGVDLGGVRGQLEAHPDATGLVWSWYSTSASASAVRSLMHQCTGLRPLYT